MHTSKSNNDAVLKRLRAGVYLAPNIPVDCFEAILEYVQSKLALTYTSLIYESHERNCTAQIENHEVDIAWVSYQKYIELVLEKKCCRLLPVSTLHHHTKLSYSDDSFGYFADVVIHSSLRTKVKEFHDLRGHRWAYTSPESYSGHGVTLKQLKQLGENANFFGDYLYSKSHLQSLNLILNRKCDAAAVDSNVLRIFLQNNPSYKDQLTVLTSWGPLPPYPIVVNSHVGAEGEKMIEEVLLNMHKTEEGVATLNKFCAIKFTKNSAKNYTSVVNEENEKKPTVDSNIQTSKVNNKKQTKSQNQANLTTLNKFETPYY